VTSAPERAAPGDPGARRLGQILRRATDHLAAKGVDTPRLDAELLLAHALGLSRLQLYTEHDRPLTDAERSAARELVRRRAAREPVAYILGEWGFRRLTLRVDRRALVPRPETEVLVERCLAHLAGTDAPRVLDVGVGSGAIALAIADEHPGALVTGVDTSQDALALARENAQLTGLAVELREGGFDDADGDWDLVVSNPPYVSAADFESLQPEIRLWEPRGALVGEGLHEELAGRVRRGRLALEVGDGQAPRVVAALGSLGYEDVRTTHDLAGRERVVDGLRR
jgi:release factor glutamine methyltransferase